jgi:hypothetical protein
MVALAQILRNKRTGRVLITLSDNFGYELSAPMGYISLENIVILRARIGLYISNSLTTK